MKEMEKNFYLFLHFIHIYNHFFRRMYNFLKKNEYIA